MLSSGSQSPLMIQEDSPKGTCGMQSSHCSLDVPEKNTAVHRIQQPAGAQTQQNQKIHSLCCISLLIFQPLFIDCLLLCLFSSRSVGLTFDLFRPFNNLLTFAMKDLTKAFINVSTFIITDGLLTLAAGLSDTYDTEYQLLINIHNCRLIREYSISKREYKYTVKPHKLL